MDIATIGGLLIGVGAILISFLMEGGSLASIFKGPAVMIVIFGTLGAGMITTSLRNVMTIPTYLKIAFAGKRPDHLSAQDP